MLLQGETGLPGPEGPTGEVGMKGSRGPSGPLGARGFFGPVVRTTLTVKITLQRLKQNASQS